MLIYILKSVACLAILFLFYKLFLEKENMHMFKRFYLLGSLAFALIVPTLVFTEYVMVEPQPLTETQQPVITDYDYIGIAPALEKDVFDIEPVLWTVYFLGVIFFGLKFLRNLIQIFLRIRKNPKFKNSSFVQVLLQEKIPPHTFFKYIFLNKKKFESKEIPKEVILHEETHAKQRHSLDVVLIELLQVVFWINPLIYFFKKAIKLNHEFLADQAVLKKEVDPKNYQNTLLSFLSSESEKKYQPALPNAINYSSIKKRFTVMKTKTSKKAAVLRTVLLLPLLAILIFGFSETKLIERQNENPSITILIDVKNNNELWLNEKRVALEDLSTKISELLPEEKSYNLLTIAISTSKELHSEFLSKLNSELEKLDPTSITVFAEEYIMPEDEFQEEIDTSSGTIRLTSNKITLVKPLENATPEEIIKYNELAEKYNAVQKEKRKIPLEELKILETVFQKMSAEQKTNSQPFPECPQQNESQNGGTKEQLAEYNALANKYNTMSRSKMRIEKKDVKRLEYLYALLDEEQKANAEPFPDFPEPPTPPDAPNINIKSKNLVLKTGGVEIDGKPHSYTTINGVTTFYNKEGKEVNADGSLIKKVGNSNISPPPSPPKAPHSQEEIEILTNERQMVKQERSQLKQEQAMEQQERALIKQEEAQLKQEEALLKQEQILLEEERTLLSPPQPPIPPDPIDHIIEMAKQGATFYYKRKKISSDKAIDLIKNNKNLSISTKKTNNQIPVVKISKSL